MLLIFLVVAGKELVPGNTAVIFIDIEQVRVICWVYMFSSLQPCGDISS